MVYITAHVVYIAAHVVYTTVHVVYTTAHVVYTAEHVVYTTAHVVYTTAHVVYTAAHHTTGTRRQYPSIKKIKNTVPIKEKGKKGNTVPIKKSTPHDRHHKTVVQCDAGCVTRDMTHFCVTHTYVYMP